MRLRTKMLLLTTVVFTGLLSNSLLGILMVEQVKVGGPIYETIAHYKGLLERIATLKSDLNQVRAESLNLIVERDDDRLNQIHDELEYLAEAIDTNFTEALATTRSEQRKVAILDAQRTWGEFAATIDDELLPAARAGDRSRARNLATGVQKLRYTRFIEQVGGVADVLAFEVEDLEDRAALTIKRDFMACAAVTGVIFLAVLIAVLFINRSVTGPILTTVSFAQSVARGDLAQTLDEKSRDETGDLTRALNAMVTGLSSMVQRVSQSSKELTRISRQIFGASKQVVDAAQLQARGVEETSSAITGINTSIRLVAGEIDGLSESSAENTTSILEMAATIDEVAQNVEVLSESVEVVVAAVSEMAASIRQISSSAGVLLEAAESATSSATEMDAAIRQVEDTATTSVSIAEQVQNDAEMGRLSVESTITGTIEIRRAARVTSEVMKSLSSRAENIGAILSVIDDVCDQTNLLALNAAIIAAQAGDQGRSFAVVAGEIKELAERTGGSTSEIAAVIQAVQDEAQRAVDSIEEAEAASAAGEQLSRESGEALNKIVAGVGRMTDQMGEIVKATQEETRESQLIKAAMEKVSVMVSQIVGATREQEKGSESITTAAERMNELTSQVRSSTQEQSSASGLIAVAAEDARAMIQRTKAACDEQSLGSERIVQAVADIESCTTVNLEVTVAMDSAVSSLAEQIRVLEEEMGSFAVEPPSPVDS